MMFAASILIAGCLMTVACAVRRHFDPNEVATAVQLLEDGERARVVVRRFDVSPSLVYRLWTHYQETGQYTRRQGQGRSRMTTPRQDSYLVMLSHRKCMSTAQSLEIDFRRLLKFTYATRLLGIDSMRRVCEHVSTRTGSCVTGGRYSSQMKAGYLCQLMICVLGCGDARESVILTVTLWKSSQ